MKTNFVHTNKIDPATIRKTLSKLFCKDVTIYIYFFHNQNRFHEVACLAFQTKMNESWVSGLQPNQPSFCMMKENKLHCIYS